MNPKFETLEIKIKIIPNFKGVDSQFILKMKYSKCILIF